MVLSVLLNKTFSTFNVNAISIRHHFIILEVNTENFIFRVVSERVPCQFAENQFAESQNAELYIKYYVKCFGVFNVILIQMLFIVLKLETNCSISI